MSELGPVSVSTAWNSYYSKYIDMKKGGAVGISMLLAGYCVLSYCWQYEHMSKGFFLASLSFQGSLPLGAFLYVSCFSTGSTGFHAAQI